MDYKKPKLIKLLILVFLILFPFGQLLSLKKTLFGIDVNILPIDFVAGTAWLIVLAGIKKRSQLLNSIIAVCLVFAFTYLISVVLFGFPLVARGSLYLIRFIAYLGFFYAVYLSVVKENDKKLLLKFLLTACGLVAVFGWLQYLNYPDLRSLYYIGWDDHLFRLVGTYLDPGFTSLILVFGLIISLANYLKKKSSLYLILTAFFLISIAFTYARAAYLALVAGLFVLTKIKKSIYKIITIGFIFLILIAILPRPEGYGVRLERTHSIIAKFTNYSETLMIFKKQPLFGVGFNNICMARLIYLNDANPQSHACNGSDSSLLFLLASSGVVGTVVFLRFLYGAYTEASDDLYGLVFRSSALAVCVHSLFVNSLFYPWVMGYLAILMGISLKRQRTP